MFPNIGVGPPNHPFVHRVFHYFHHPFCFFSFIFGNIHIEFTHSEISLLGYVSSLEGIVVRVENIYKHTSGILGGSVSVFFLSQGRNELMNCQVVDFTQF